MKTAKFSSVMRVAHLMSADMLPDNPDRRVDGYEHDLQFGALQRAGAAHDISFESLVWDDLKARWADFDAVIVGTAWDYADKRDAFFETLAQIDQQTRLFNPLALMRWNVDKIYLRELAQKGVPTIPTIWADHADEATIANAFDALGCDDLVIKPRIGAGAWRQARLKQGAVLPAADDLPPGVCFIQPFLPTIGEYGEVSMLYYNGQYSHAALKKPEAGDYRVQSSYGGFEHTHTPDAAEHAAAQKVMEAMPQMPLYARIDLVRNVQNQPVLIEVEMIEPYHYPEQGPGFAENLITALLARMS